MLLSFGRCGTIDPLYEYEFHEEISSESIPNDVDEAISLMHQLLPHDANTIFVMCEGNGDESLCRDFFVNFEERLRRDISNEWMRPNNSPLADAYRSLQIENPEEMAYALIADYVEHLQDPN
jgi:hypothetical protein